MERLSAVELETTAPSAHLLADPQAREGLVEVTVPKCEQTHVRPSKAFGPQGERGPQARRTGRLRTEDASGRWLLCPWDFPQGERGPQARRMGRLMTEGASGHWLLCPWDFPWNTGMGRILEWVSSSRGSSQTRGQTCISCIGRQVLYCCTTRFVLVRDPTEDNSLGDSLSVALRGCSKEGR